MKKLFSTLLLLLFSMVSFSQDFSLGGDQGAIVDPVKWETYAEKINDKEYYLVFKAKIQDKWHLYSQYNPEGASLPLDITSEEADSLFTIEGKALESMALKGYSETWKKDEIFFDHNATLKQKIKLLKEGVTKVNLNVFGQACKKECVLVGGDFEFDLSKAKEVTPMPSNNPFVKDGKLLDISKIENGKVDESEQKESKGLWTIFILSFLGGFIALFTPCVFPMIPLTVSFFTKQSKNKAQGIRNALIYGLSIIALYVILGTIVVAIFGPDKLNELSTDPWFNLAFFILLFVFALSFLGAFEIMLPNSWANKLDQQADKGGVLGIVFMALALAVVSFSCTGPIVGTTLVEASSKGGIAPVISMLGFSSALAIPFVLFAAFPGWLNSLPQSGGWLNSVKVFLGFLELAFAFKFLSMVDLAWDLHWIERETFIAIWIAVFGTMALYLFGKIRLPHDSPLTHISVGRLLTGILTLTFVIYLIPGLWGAPLKFISGFPPPMNYSESPYGVGYKKLGGGSVSSEESLPDGAYLMKPFDIVSFKDFDKGLAYAKKVNKPILVDFTGINCVNCRKMEEQVWTSDKVLPILKNEVVLISLYVDVRTKLPKSEQYVSKTTGKKIRTVGNKWSDFQIKNYKANAQPYYVILNHDSLTPLNGYTAYDPDIDKYYNWLREGIDKFKE